MSNFTKTEKSYDTAYVLDLIRNKKKEEIKKYISYYFIKLSTIKNVVMWIPDKRGFELLDDSLIKSRYFTSDLVIYEKEEINGHIFTKKWSLDKWFFSSENSIYTPCSKIGKEKILQVHQVENI